MSYQDTHAATSEETAANLDLRDIPNFPGYRAGKEGTIWSCIEVVRAKRGFASILTDNWRQLKTGKDTRGRPYAILQRDKRSVGRLIHRLVLEVFVGPCPEGQECCHNNGDQTDNRLENLRWDTKASNMRDMERHGTRVKGSKHHAAKLDEVKVGQIKRLLADGVSEQVVAVRFNVTHGAIWFINKGRSWKHVTADPPVSQSVDGKT